MNKKDLIANISKSTDLSKVVSEKFLVKFMETVSKTLAVGDEVILPGFGAFAVVQYSEREGVNPQTQEKIKIPAQKKVLFRVGKILRDTVSGL